MKCHFCDKVFSEIAVLFKDLKVFHGFERYYTYINDGCLRKFVSIPILKQHSLRCDKLKTMKFNIDKRSVNPPKSAKPSNIKTKTLLDSVNLKEIQSPMPTTCVTKKNDFLDENGSDKLEMCIEDAILSFIGKLYTGHIVTKSVVEEIMTAFIQTVRDVILLFMEKLRLILPVEYHVKIDNMRHIQVLDDLRSDYKRKQFLKKANVLLEPKSFLLGEINDDNKQKKQWF